MIWGGDAGPVPELVEGPGFKVTRFLIPQM